MTIRRKRSRTEVRGRTTRACAARGARATGSGMTAKLADRYPLYLGRRPCSRGSGRLQAQASTDGPVVRGRLRENLAGEHVDVVAHEDVVDLAVRLVRRATCARAPRAASPGSIATTPGPQKLQSPATTTWRPRRRELRPQRAEVAQRARTSRASTTCALRPRRPRCRARRSCTINAERRPVGVAAEARRSADHAPRERPAAASRSRPRTWPSPGIVVPRAGAC